MIVIISDLGQIRLSNLDKKIVFADGTFDLFHVGHVKAMQNLRTFGDIVVVGVLSDEWVKKKKGNGRPILTEAERLLLVDSVRYIDYTVLHKDGPERVPTSKVLSILKPDIFVSLDSQWKQRVDFFENLKIELKIIDRIDPSSTTDLLNRIKSLSE